MNRSATNYFSMMKHSARFCVSQVLYTGKSAALGIKQGGPAAGKWAELPITKSPKIVQVAMGHDGQHVLLLAEDGSIFFAGTPRRGEDADGSVGECGRVDRQALDWELGSSEIFAFMHPPTRLMCRLKLPRRLTFIQKAY